MTERHRASRRESYGRRSHQIKTRRPVFGQDAPPATSNVRMAYVARHPGCGHVKAYGPESGGPQPVLEVAPGMVLERIPLADVPSTGGICDICREPEQLEALG